ncbi:glycosyltransferase family 2 protein [Rhizorhabdus dicambivorans]|uniref:Glycosyl transferase n=1 Tax=Rhizorhabdus dicambivorans TaxID=1850238 RepID=A0A2A4FXJ8_9SPHN|nr:glycosyltransferase [Rhizorhabdus dicambivorans]ATE66991.1 glycosyl transferase [Rhizorhabdus dicambivorans]PCE42133.1 glycosyl transferase [Rhizorhabdus dicambivorans]
MCRTDVAVVVIGRNEGARLERSLASARGYRTIYVDSGSTDGSPERARAAGVELIELEELDGYSAARGRNAGIDRALDDPDIGFVQVLDGDCALDPGWIAAGVAALDAHPGVGGVFGRLREQDPDLSIYAWMCDVEWATTPGPAEFFGGDVLFRAQALRDTGRYRAGMIAGEDPDFAIRMRTAGWHLLCLAQTMAIHDSSMARFGQWWRRTVRAGHAFAELVDLHPGSPFHHFARNELRILFWAGAVPVAAVAGLSLGVIADRRWTLLALAALLLLAFQIARVALREMRHHPPRRAWAHSLFLAIGKYAEMIGLLRYHRDRRLGRKARLIEYKAR